ncbi:MAG: rod shape-determining protein RodA [Rickettsiales bacterium]|jgi:rod shape determining protein RodA|nr:rod shape-determining protein RodA [Rickettsiales bacterium]
MFGIDFIKEDLIDNLKNININIIVVFCSIFLVGEGLLYSAGSGGLYHWASKQLIFFIIFFLFALLIAVVDINVFFKFSYVFYFVGLLLLLIVEIKGHKAMGATRWINAGLFKLQPSEIMKVCLILQLGKIFQSYNLKDIRSNKKIIIPVLYFIAPFILILRQPNLGTALILAFITLGIFFLVGVEMWKFWVVLVVSVVLLPFVWSYGLKDYQKQRVLTFLNPEDDPLNSGYNIIQSKIAIGSGGTWGKGFLKGTQGQLEFLPEKHTDFVFTILCEEFGLVGSFFVIILYIIYFIYLICVTANCKHTFGRVIVGGILLNTFCHFFMNLGMISGILPVIGTPLPLLSYGGSITATTLISLGLVLNVDINKYKELKLVS